MTSVKDTIHGYVHLNSFERKVIDSAWFQRLRRVKQNDVSSAVYPTMRATRFEHSLGAMHLAGLCLASALDVEKGHEPSIKAFLDSFHIEVKAIEPRLASIPPTDVAKLAVQIARLYGALHDIGHPPYSHLLEACYSAREVYGRSISAGDDWHEYNGQQIVERFLPDSADLNDIERAQLSVVAHLGTKGVKQPALRALKGLVVNVIDVDRMDFVLRDGRTSGSEFGAYDKDRLITSFKIHVHFANKSPSEIFIRPAHSALSAVESLLQERHKIYRWVHFHHRVILSKALMRYALQATKSDFDPSCLQAENYVRLDDPTAPYTLIGDDIVDRHLDSELLKLLDKAAREPLTEAEKRLLGALEVLVLRKRLGLSLWKRLDEYRELPNSFERLLLAEFDKAGRQPPRKAAVDRFGCLANWFAAAFLAKGNWPLLQKVVAALNEGRTDEWFLLEVAKVSTPNDDRLIVGGASPRVEHLENVSSIAAGLREAIKHDVHLFAFRFSHDAPSEDERQAAKNRGRKEVARVLAKCYREDDEFRQQVDALLK